MFTSNMKTTQYFQATRLRSDRSVIKAEWITSVIQNPKRIVVQADSYHRKDQADRKNLR